MDYGLYDQQFACSPGKGTFAFYRPNEPNVSTKGTYTAIIDSLPANATGFMLYSGSHTTSGSLCLLDIGVGPHGSEQVIVSDIIQAADINLGGGFFIPIGIKAGSRVGIRASGNGNCNVSLSFYNEGVNYTQARFSRAVTYGADTANSTGTTVAASGTPGTRGAWTQIAASVTQDHQAFIFLAHKNAANVALTGFSFDVGQGASGSEKIVFPNIYQIQSAAASSNGQHRPWGVFIPASLKAGSRLAVRACSDFSATPGNSAVVIIGLSI